LLGRLQKGKIGGSTPLLLNLKSKSSSTSNEPLPEGKVDLGLQLVEVGELFGYRASARIADEPVRV
jgi:hypothetical protein